MTEIRALTFDLDDTLWPVAPVIEFAENHCWQWLKRNHPTLTDKYDPDSLRDLRQQVAQSHPEIVHDVTQLRSKAFEIAFNHCGIDTDAVADAMSVFLDARNRVQPFEDCETALSLLNQHYKIAAITNGNADVSKTPLARFFSHAIRADEAGCAKPDREIFELAATQIGVKSSQVLHIGDHPEHDVLGALDAGMQAMWISRAAEPWPHDRTPHFKVANLTEAVSVLIPPP